MSTITSVFANPHRRSIKSELSSKRLSIILTKNTASDVGTLLEGVYSGVFISVFDEHGLEDDCGINFSNYYMEIDFKETENDLAIIHLAINLANSIHNQLNCDTMVVRNFQHLIVEL